MLNIKNPRIIIPAMFLYAIFIFYLSVTSKIGNIKYQLNTALGKLTVKFLVTSGLSFILDLVVGFFNFIERRSIDLGHVGVYFVFGILLYFVCASSRNQMLKRHSAVFAIFIGTAYGILNEIFQIYLPYRTASVADALSNLLGLVLAQVFVILFDYTEFNLLIKNR
jgi:VanZ family protein